MRKVDIDFDSHLQICLQILTHETKAQEAQTRVQKVSKLLTTF